MKRHLLLISIIFCNLILIAQHPNILITSQGGPNEPAIRVNPYNTNQILAGSNLNYYFVSEDGGLTWTTDVLSSDAYGVWGDPCIIIDTAQTFYYFHLSNPWDGNWIDRIVCQKTSDMGQTWNVGSYMGLDGTTAQDKEWAIVNRDNNNIYVSWTHFDDYGSDLDSDKSKIKFSKSTDQGETWSEAIIINEVDGDCIDEDNTVEGAVPAIGPNGEIYVSWAGPEGLVLDRSLDEGETWLDNDIFVTDFPGGWDYNIPGISRCNGLPITVCDTSNTIHNGNLYINWTDQRNGTSDTDVWLIKSTDGGNTWGEPKRVNDDPAGKQQFFTWVDIDQTNGYLYFVFYDRRNHEDQNTDVYMAVSKDGGETFTNFRISESPFNPNSSAFFGDYTNVSAHNNVIRPIWTRLDNTNLSMYTAIIDADVIGVDQIAEEVVNLEPGYPNPFQSETNLKLKLKKDEVLTIVVCDLLGNQVAVLNRNEKFIVGKHLIRFNPEDYNLNPGIYFMNVSGNHTDVKQKMIYVD